MGPAPSLLALLLLLASPAASAAASGERGPEASLGILPPGARSPREPSSVLDSNGAKAFVEEVEGAPEIGSGALRVRFTVLPELEERLRRVLAEGGVRLGHLILMDPESGELYAYVSTDPARFPATQPYPMASLMKVVTAAAVLRNAPKATQQSCRFVGSRWDLLPEQLTPPAAGLGLAESFVGALANSNNQCFARFAVHDVGEGPLLEEMRSAGLLEAPAPLHAAGKVDPPSGRLALGHLGSGMAGAFITPLAAVRLAGAMAHGELVEPFWIAELRDPEGKPLPMPQRRPARPVWTRGLLERLRPGLLEVTESGTASRAFHDARGGSLLGPVRVAGKTGTVSGSLARGEYQWFIGVAPAEAPTVAVAAIVVQEGGASRSASQIAASALRAVFCQENCAPAYGERLHEMALARDAALAAELERLHPPAPSPEILVVSARELGRPAAPASLDEPLRPLGEPELEFPRKLLRKRVSGRVVLRLTVSEEGRVMDSAVDSSDLPDFNEHVSQAVRQWSFTPPRRGGRPVVARALLPIPIRIE